MAGHSHFSNIKRKKEALDQKKALTFAKISRHITTSVKEKGGSIETNPSLRIAILKAKEADMPKEKIERAIQRGLGREERLIPFIFEAYGPCGVAMIIEGSTENKQRALEEVKDIIRKINGKMAEPGSVKWLFEQKGVVKVFKKEDFFIEEKVEDIEEDGEFIILYTSPEKTEGVKLLVEKNGGEVFSSFIGWKPVNLIEIEKGTYENIIEKLEENDSIERIYLNVKI